MLADFLAHPDEFVKYVWKQQRKITKKFFFCSITDYQTPRERFIQVVKWYLSAFHAGRKSPVAKKPYNPILGEIFQCWYDIGSTPDVSEISNIWIEFEIFVFVYRQQ
jgi:hypothetical protein